MHAKKTGAEKYEPGRLVNSAFADVKSQCDTYAKPVQRMKDKIKKK